MKKIFTLSLLIAVLSARAVSQEMHDVVNASGGTYTGSNYSCEWSIGELVLVNEMTAGDGKCILTNGFLQPSVGKKHVNNSPAVIKGHEVRLFNNPVKSLLGVELISNEPGVLRLTVYDERGYIKYHGDINVAGVGSVTNINMSHYTNGNYLLKTEFLHNGIVNNRKVQSFKIVKIH